MDQTNGSAAVPRLDVDDPDFAGPPPWLVIEDEPEPHWPIPPDPLGEDPFRDDPDAAATEPAAVEDGPAAWQWLATMAPGPGLAAELETTNPTAVGLYGVVELIAGYERIVSWAHSRAIELTGVLARRPGINPHHPLPGGKIAAETAAGEIAPRLGISRYSARRMVHEASLFRDKLDQTAEALRLGHIDQAKASSLARQLSDQPADVAWEVQRQVLPQAPHQTPSQVSRAAERAIIAVDPHRATQRHRRARDQRRVDHPRPLPDGMAALHAVLPATDAAGLDLALEAAARSAKAAGDTRTIDQLRADALALMGHAALDDGYIGRREPVAGSGGADTGPAPASVPCSGTVCPPAPAGGGSVCPCPPAPGGSVLHGAADGGRDDVEDATDADVDDGADALQPVSDYLRMLRMPVGTIGGRRAHVRVTVPLSVLVLPPESQAGFGPYGECLDHLEGRAPDPLPGDSSVHGDSSAHLPGPPEPAPPDDRADLAEVAELEGYGPITPDVARALAMSAGTWQRLVTDPLSGAVLDVGRTRYRPPAALAEFVRARDRSCIVPGCSTPAYSCEIDHIEPHPVGPTSAFNLALLCRGHHACKTLGAFQLRHHEDGSFEWTTPSGHSYRRDRRGRITVASAGPSTEGDPPF